MHFASSMQTLPAGIALDRLPGPKRSKWPAGFFRDELVWSPSKRRFALAYSIAEIRINNDVGCVLWGERREEASSALLGNPARVLACCWDRPWCVWLDDEVFVFKAHGGLDHEPRWPLVLVHASKGFALLPGSDNVDSWPTQVKDLPADLPWHGIGGLSRAIRRGEAAPPGLRSWMSRWV